jgi:hypothetical protein
VSPQYISGKFLFTFSSHDFNKILGKMEVQTFNEKYPEAVADFRNAWIEYMKYCYQVESGEIVESVAQNRSTATLIDLDRDPKGYPLVPQEGGNLIMMRRIIQSFVTAHYRNYNQFYYLYISVVLIYYQVLHLAGNTIGSHGNKLKNTPTISSMTDISPNQWTASLKLKIRVK